MISFKLGQLHFSLPSSWNDITVAQFMAYVKNNEKIKDGDLFEIISIMTGIDYKFWSDVNIPDIDMQRIFAAIEWIKEIPDFKTLPMPKVYHLGDKAMKIPKDLTLETFGQKIVFQQKIEKGIDKENFNPEIIGKNFYNAFDELLSIYFYPSFTGNEFDVDDLEETLNAVRQSKFIEAFPIANFFLNKYVKSSQPKEKPLYQFRKRRNLLLGLMRSSVSA